MDEVTGREILLLVEETGSVELAVVGLWLVGELLEVVGEEEVVVVVGEVRVEVEVGEEVGEVGVGRDEVVLVVLVDMLSTGNRSLARCLSTILLARTRNWSRQQQHDQRWERNRASQQNGA